jgi:hypothetical protein
MAQRRRRARIVDAISGVLRQIDHLHGCAGGQFVMGKGCNGELFETLKLLFVRELLECLHHRTSLNRSRRRHLT